MRKGKCGVYSSWFFGDNFLKNPVGWMWKLPPHPGRLASGCLSYRATSHEPTDLPPPFVQGPIPYKFREI